MFALRKDILPQNRTWVDNYLESVWLPAVKTIESLLPATRIPSHVKTKFRQFVQMEERRITEKLESIKYNIDALETVQMIMGTGSIENVSTSSCATRTPQLTPSKHVFPLLYLLLKRHMRLFRIATRKSFHEEAEFLTAANSLRKIYEAMTARYNELLSTFEPRVSPLLSLT